MIMIKDKMANTKLSGDKSKREDTAYTLYTAQSFLCLFHIYYYVFIKETVSVCSKMNRGGGK